MTDKSKARMEKLANLERPGDSQNSFVRGYMHGMMDTDANAELLDECEKAFEKILRPGMSAETNTLEVYANSQKEAFFMLTKLKARKE